MKHLYILSAMALLGAPLFAQESDDEGSRNIAMRPSEKRSLALNPSERNPYAKRAVEEKVAEVENAEEIALRKQISELTVTGASRTNMGSTLLLGDIVVRQGMILPPIIPNQTQFLQVVEISEKRMVLEWLNPDTGALTGKKIQVPYDLTPSVIYVLQGQAAGSQEIGVFKPRR